MPIAALLLPVVIYGWIRGMKWLERNLPPGRLRRFLLWPRK
jgi:hypothetical protein